MANSKFEERLKLISSGRGYSPAYIKSIVKDFLSTEIKDALDLDGDRYFIDQTASDVGKIVGLNKGGYTCRELIDGMYDKCSHTLRVPTDLCLCLSLISHNKRMNAFFDLPIEEYMDAAGASDGYDRWFMLDAMTWERDHKGRIPSIGDAVRGAFRTVMDDRDDSYRISRGFAEMILPYDGGQSGKGINRAFARSIGEPGSEMPGSIAACWIWILMVEVPLMMMLNTDGKTRFPRVTIQV
ncbi:MAG: hypothetical protein ILP17_04885 [Lachnospiraceae bacterium]|nr:hypothetical protein [Lachnospiraceae bacterium]